MRQILDYQENFTNQAKHIGFLGMSPLNYFGYHFFFFFGSFSLSGLFFQVKALNCREVAKVYVVRAVLLKIWTGSVSKAWHLLEMKIWHLHSRPAESEPLAWSPRTCALISSPAGSLFAKV